MFDRIRKLLGKNSLNVSKSQTKNAQVSSTVIEAIGNTAESPFDEAIALVDDELSRVVSLIVHHEKFQLLEGRWRGLHWLVENSLLGQDLRVQVLDISKRELIADLDQSELEQTSAYAKIHQERIADLDSYPFAVIVGDFEFSHSQEDLATLSSLGKIAMTCFVPFVASPSPRLFGMPDDQDWKALNYTDETAIENRFLNPAVTEMEGWRNFRSEPEASFVVLTLPRVVARRPFGSCKISQRSQTFAYEEFPFKYRGYSYADDNHKHCWMSSAFCLGWKMGEAFSLYGWGVWICSGYGGGIEELPLHPFVTDNATRPLLTSADIPLPLRRVAIFNKVGVTALSEAHEPSHPVGFVCPVSCQKIELGGQAVTNRIDELMAFTRGIHAIHRMLLLGQNKHANSRALANTTEKWFTKNFVDDSLRGGQRNQPIKPFGLVKIKPCLDEPSKAMIFEVTLRPRFQVEAFSAQFRIKI